MSRESEYFKVLEDIVELEENVVFEESKSSVRITTADFVDEARKLGAVSGVRILRKNKAINPTSNVVFLFHRRVKKKVVLSWEEIKRLLRFGEIEHEVAREKQGYYVVFSEDNLPISLCFLKNGKIVCMMPKEYREQVLSAIESDAYESFLRNEE